MKRRTAWKSLGGLTAAVALLMTGSLAYSDEERPVATADSAVLTTWSHENAIATSEPISGEQVRQSQFYESSVAPVAESDTSYSSFVYMSVPRGGNEKIGYTEEDGAEFAADAEFTMSWTSFEYAADVWVDVTLTSGQSISSADQVTIRPTNLELDKELVDGSTIRVKVPYSDDGYRFSVEFDPQLVTVYNKAGGPSGTLTTDPSEGTAIHTEPQNAMLVFANPKPTGAAAEDLIPTEESGSIHRPAPGLINDLHNVTDEIIYFEPGTYYMGSDYHAVLPENVRWIYLAPGAYVKGAFQFVESAQPGYKVTGHGVLSGEMYVYEPDTQDGYRHSVNDNCHGDCVKMLQFQSANTGQTLDIQGITVKEPPYHSFVIYAHEDGEEVRAELSMNVEGYKQVGAWYWQTDGLELYKGTEMRNTFFHANDDVLKLYHPDVTIENTVIWKNENGPVFQWGWVPRNVDNVHVRNTDVIHNRMYWRDVKTNTCVINASPHWEDPGARDRADVDTSVRNMTFTNTRVEGAVNCAIRVYALSNLEDITFDGLEIDEWNDLDAGSQVSTLTMHADSEGSRVSIGDEIHEGNGLLLHNYTVGGTSILKAGNNWASDELGRLGFDPEVWEGWDATSDDQATGTAPRLTVDDLVDNAVMDSRELTVEGSTDAQHLTIRVAGVETEAPVTGGRFSLPVNLPDLSNRVVITATGANGVMAVERFTLHAYGTRIGQLTDPEGDDYGPGTYNYPTNSAFNPGSKDLVSLDVYEDGEIVRFVTGVAGPIHNPWGGNGMSTQRLHIYLNDTESEEVTPLLPGTNTSASGEWSFAIVVAGRHETSQFGSGVFAADLERIDEVDLEVDPAGRIFASVNASALGGIDLRSAGYQVSMFSDGEDGEGIGNIRPVYSSECAEGIDCPEWVGQFYPTGGAGSFADDVEARDTDISDSNALDIISGEADQRLVMDWRSGPVVVPYVQLETDAGDVDPSPVPSVDPSPTISPEPSDQPVKPAPAERGPGLPSTGK